MKLYQLKILNKAKEWLNKNSNTEALGILNSSDPKDISIKIDKEGSYLLSIKNKLSIIYKD